MSRKTYDVTALGELLIDFTENGVSAQGNPLMEANPGGAPCNVLAMLKRLSKKPAFIGKIGEDIFGKQLEKALQDVGIDTRGLKKSEDFLYFFILFSDFSQTSSQSFYRITFLGANI